MDRRQIAAEVTRTMVEDFELDPSAVTTDARASTKTSGSIASTPSTWP